ncbi:MAG: hypothetical protein IKG42_04925 [Clostridia bacterium]|nr:hypothetical protein [Clostridia bacterium]
MDDFPTRKITIYHKNDKVWDRYVKEASYRNNSILNHNKNGNNSTDNVIIRIFDTEGYHSNWFISEGDIVVNKEVNDVIEGNTPNTQLSKIYGKENVHKVTSINDLTFNDEELRELMHIKIGAV